MHLCVAATVAAWGTPTAHPMRLQQLCWWHEHALTRIAELEAVADEPFEHTDALRDKRYRLDTLTAQLQTSADSPEAKR